MGDRTLLERVIIIEESIRVLSARLDALRGSVVLVAKKKPGPKLNRKKIEADVRRKIKAGMVKPGFKRIKIEK